ncbi:hypothetical protein C8R46DRAFT_45231 [Mycena filopes]|nr:hypothetical protein C8R46DRAFT_45231 [Mycena filopes]
MRPAHQIYASQLGQLNLGYPLWCPEPRLYDKVKPGDVGYLKDGSFHRLFNATLDADHPEQTLGVPPLFRPLELPEEPCSQNNKINHGPYKYFDPGTLRSSSVSEFRYGVDVNGLILPGGAGIHFSCSTKQGALLHLSKPALREELLAEGFFETYTRQNFRHWYDFANKTLGRGVKDGMVIVTSCDRTFEWASAVFDDRSKDAEISFEISGISGVSAQLSFSGKWDYTSSVQHRSGPIHEGTDEPKIDQTIFIRGWKVLERPLRAPKVIRAAAEPRSRSPSPDSDEDHTDSGKLSSVSDDNESTESEWALESIPRESRVYHQSDALLQYILDHSQEDVAIVHDDHWCGFSAHPALHASVADILQNYERSFFDDGPSRDEWNVEATDPSPPDNRLDAEGYFPIVQEAGEVDLPQNPSPRPPLVADSAEGRPERGNDDYVKRPGNLVVHSRHDHSGSWGAGPMPMSPPETQNPRYSPYPASPSLPAAPLQEFHNGIMSRSPSAGSGRTTGRPSSYLHRACENCRHRKIVAATGKDLFAVDVAFSLRGLWSRVDIRIAHRPVVSPHIQKRLCTQIWEVQETGGSSFLIHIPIISQIQQPHWNHCPMNGLYINLEPRVRERSCLF